MPGKSDAALSQDGSGKLQAHFDQTIERGRRIEPPQAMPGVTVTTRVEAPGTIERSMGKMRRIADHRPR